MQNLPTPTKIVAQTSQRFHNFRFADMKIIFPKAVPTIFFYCLKYFGDKYGVRGSKVGYIFGSVAICPGIKFSHLGIIETFKKTQIDIKKQRKTKRSLKMFAVFWDLLDLNAIKLKIISTSLNAILMYSNQRICET